jgi:uncharacterized membrane protein YfcA|tara:strand:+ start:159 stop:389 length:231 start_codon:yes stop_codon:yes gene_type:complete
MSVTSLLYPNNFLPDLARVAFWVGTSAASSVLLFGATHGSVRRDQLDWRDVAVWGTIGAAIGAQFGVTQRPWFKSW